MCITLAAQVINGQQATLLGSTMTTTTAAATTGTVALDTDTDTPATAQVTATGMVFTCGDGNSVSIKTVMLGREKIEASKYFERTAPLQVFDTHIHLAVDWKEGETGLPNAWLRSEGANFAKSWTENMLKTEIAVAGGANKFQVKGAVFVECANGTGDEEAKWVLDMINDPNSIVQALVSNIDVAQGGAHVMAELAKLQQLNAVDTAVLPTAVKGCRQVLLGDPMPAGDACLDPAYMEGLAVLQAAGLHWEWCCQPNAIPSIAKACLAMPDMSFVLDHMGHNNGGDDFDTWAPAISLLAKNQNVVAKLGAIEEWKVQDPGPYIDHAFAAFGFDRVMFESNWFVSSAMGDQYDKTFGLVKAALDRAGATVEQTEAVFSGNAKRVYRL